MKTQAEALHRVMRYLNGWEHRLMGNGSIVSYRTVAAIPAWDWR